MGLPKPGPIAYIAAPRKIMVWFSLQSSTSELQWATLEQKRGRPVEEGQIPATEIIDVGNTGSLVELYTRGRTRPIILEFTAPAERDAWCRYLQLIHKVLGSESEPGTLLGRSRA
eukprot:CAMPEP_0179015826 /NCGR_PEP_ID=MMETSP0796-20121207/2998_1 /TAXON_ID=73915 /ORGANISM="Pyrodinium bahamense, Strain pbaha01" /LENGTH=114 /DNA_ID=CAMNT_0020711485 /DNA_START=259 /DNA_END=603 /DNA_ORIENTATION=+